MSKTNSLIISQQSLGKRHSTALHLEIDTYLQIEKLSYLTGRNKTELVSELIGFALTHCEVDGVNMKREFNLKSNITPTVSPQPQPQVKPTENKLFVSLSEARKITGFSRDYLYKGLSEGVIPHIKCGKNYKINIVAFLEQLNSLTS